VTKKNEHIPIYSLHTFSSPEQKSQQFQVEVFDANRHFQVMYPHRHDFFEVLYLLKGSGFHVIDSNKYEIKPPCVFFLSPGQAHKLELSNDIEGYIFLFTAEFYLINHTNQNRLLEFPFFYRIKQTNPPLILRNYNDITFLESLFVKGISEVKKENSYSLELLRSLLDLILVSCSTLYEVDESILTKGKGHILVKRFFQLIEENYQNNLSVNEYADLLVITPNHLTQTVRQLTGKASNGIIREKQILEIKRLLVHTNMGVSEIANYLNFADQSYFTKIFKRATGLTPLQYRSKSMKNT